MAERGWEYPYDQLGDKEVTIEGDTYEGKFTGKGYLIGDYEDKGNLLADNRDVDYPETCLTIEGLFPPSWRQNEEGQRAEPYVEYEIIVRAKKIPPPRT